MECPDTFDPKVGERIWVDYRVDDGGVNQTTTHLYIIEVEWHAHLIMSGSDQRSLGKRVKLAMEWADTPSQARRGLGLKK